MKINLQLTAIIILVWALPQMSTDIYLPSLPKMATYFNTSISDIQYTIFYYTIGFSLGAIFVGPLSDRIGRRPVIIWSMLIALIGVIAAIFATSLHFLFYARLLQGLALVGVSATMRAIIRDICDTKEEMAKFGAILGIVMPLAGAIAPIIGGYIEKYSFWRISFVFLAIYIIVFLIYCYKKLDETNQTPLKRPFSHLLIDVKEVLANFRFFCYNATTTIALCAMMAYLTISSYLMQVKIGLSPEQFGYTNLVISITLIVSSYLNTKLIYRQGIDKLLIKGEILLVISGSIFLIIGIFSFYNLYFSLLGIIILSWACGFIYPNASAGGLSLFRESAGTAGAVYSFFQMLGGAFGSGLISWIGKYGEVIQCLGLLLIIFGLLGTFLARKLYIFNTRVEYANK